MRIFLLAALFAAFQARGQNQQLPVIDTVNNRLVINANCHEPTELFVRVTNEAGETVFLDYHADLQTPYSQHVEFSRLYCCLLSVQVKMNEHTVERTFAVK